MPDDLGWLENIRAELLAKRGEYPSCPGAFSAAVNALDSLRVELTDYAAADEAARKEREAQRLERDALSAATKQKDKAANWRGKSSS